jgi:hypothetical protein
MTWLETGLIAVGAAAACAAAVIGVKAYKKNDRKKAEKETAEKAGEEFAEHAHAFSGLYEPLYMMAEGIIKYRASIMGDWVTRTENLTGADNYKGMWNSRLSGYSSWDKEQGLVKINELLSFVLDAGVCRDMAAEITVDNTTYKKYSTSDDEMIEAGNPAKVKTPYWFMGDEILEKGIIEKI